MLYTFVNYSVALSTLIWAIILILPWRPWGVREQLNSFSPTHDQRELPSITVLIPARNEAEHITETINSLKQQGHGVRIIVIDDQSTDNTAYLAQQAGVEVISGSPLPTGWTGKLWALQQGLQHVQTPYILQLDADISLQTGILSSLLSKLHNEQYALVSIMALLPTDSAWQKLLLPAYVWFFKMLYPFALANSQSKHFSAAAGGCILLKTEALKAIGEYTAIKEAVIDDCNLAARFKQSGKRTWVGLSQQVISRRASQSLNDVTGLVARTAFTQLRYSSMLLCLASALLILVFWLPFIGLFLSNNTSLILGVSSLLAMFITYRPLLQFYQLNPLLSFCLPVIASLYLGMTWLSAFRYWRGKGASWKGRYYTSK